jgi:thiol-disulfide isomerase/thioredoxin
MRRLMFLLSVLALISCGKEDILQSEFSTLDGSPLRLDTVFSNSNSAVLIFLSPECPLCQNYTVTINQLQSEFQDEKIAFLGVVSGEFYSTSAIEGFLIRYDLDLPIIMDPELKLANHFDASITPEAFVINQSGETQYRGAIDNWAISLGKKRLTITERYLADAIRARLNGMKIEPKKTEPVGCFIE